MINQFCGEYRWLSNFQMLETPLVYKGIAYPSVEHFYHAMKTDDVELRKTIAEHPSKGLKAFCRETIKLHRYWDNLKINVMLVGIRYKFSKSNPKLRQLLVDTGDCEIVEGNHWNDKFWGVCLKTNVGENTLGKIIMKVREEIQNE